LVEFTSVKIGRNGRPTFLDKNDKVIETKLGPKGNPLLMEKSGKPVEVVTVQFGGRGLLFGNGGGIGNGGGTVLGFEEAQACTDGVLMAQNGSLVYYAIFVNDVYASFMAGTKTGGITPTPIQFPTTASDLAKITAFNGGKAFPDANALAVEVKTAWVEATGLDASKYVTITSTIPTFDQSNPSTWTPNGSKTATLALVGIHVVGSTAGHPEMIWATFEHIGNTPNAAYSYNTATSTKSQGQDTSGTWLFCASNAAGPFNVPRMFVPGPGPNIVATPGNTIGPSNTLRLNAWGANPQQTPNPFDFNTAASNSEIISINNSILGMLAAGDVRKNYILTGATWTIGGAVPSGQFPSGGNEVGTSQMANTTMETYQQGSNCFDCHSGNMLGVPNANPGQGLSHIFGNLQPPPAR
jgi:hypothetical protein